MLLTRVLMLLGGHYSLPVSPKGAERTGEKVQEQTRASPADSFLNCPICHGKTREDLVIAKLCTKTTTGWDRRGGRGRRSLLQKGTFPLGWTNEGMRSKNCEIRWLANYPPKALVVFFLEI